MNYNKDNTIILTICGKSASGKDTLAKWIAKNLSASSLPSHLVISDTTRPKRVGEQDGKHYRFISKDTFKNRINTGHYIEYTKYKNWYYGTPFDDIHFGAINIMVVNKKGLKNMYQYNQRFTIIPIYIQVPFSTRLKRSIDREQKIKIEYFRRGISDFISFLNINKIINQYCKKIIFGKDECTIWRQGVSIMHFLQHKVKLPVGNS